MRPPVRLPRCGVGVRAAHVPARGERGRLRARGIHARLLPPGAGPVRRGDHHEAVARHEEEPQGAAAARALPRRPHPDLLSPRYRRARRPARPAAAGVTEPAGAVYLPAAAIAERVSELAAAIDRDHRGAPLTLVAVLKGAVVLCADLS